MYSRLQRTFLPEQKIELTCRAENRINLPGIENWFSDTLRFLFVTCACLLPFAQTRLRLRQCARWQQLARNSRRNLRLPSVQSSFLLGQESNSISDRSQIPSRAGVKFYLRQKPNSIPGRSRILSQIRRNSSSQTNTRRISYGHKSSGNLHHRRRQRVN